MEKERTVIRPGQKVPHRALSTQVPSTAPLQTSDCMASKHFAWTFPDLKLISWLMLSTAWVADATCRNSTTQLEVQDIYSPNSEKAYSDNDTNTPILFADLLYTFLCPMFLTNFSQALRLRSEI